MVAFGLGFGHEFIPVFSGIQLLLLLRLYPRWFPRLCNCLSYEWMPLLEVELVNQNLWGVDGELTCKYRKEDV